MNRKDMLFDLIASLSKSEKRYFKLNAAIHKNTEKANYIRLFDAIDKQKKYDEKRLLKQFAHTSIGNNFSVNKHYLYNLILAGLRSYRTTTESLLYNYVHNISILYEKGLYSQCERIVIKAKRIAVKYDLQLPLLELMNWEVKLIHMQSFIGSDKEKIKQVFNEIFNSIEQYNTTNKYILQCSLLFLNEEKTGNTRSHSEIKALQKIMGNPLFRTDEGNLSFQSLLRFYSAYGVYFFHQNDYTKAYTYHQKLIQLLEENPHHITETPLKYAQAINNLFVSGIYLKKFPECSNVIEKLKKLQVKSVTIRNHIDFLIDNLTLLLCLETGAFKEGVQLVELTGSKWDKMESTMITKGKILLFQYNAAYIYFITKNYYKANEYLNKIINGTIDIGSDIQCFAQILSLIVYYELGKEDLLAYRVKAVYRFLCKRKQLYKIETVILSFIRKELPRIHSEKALMKTFKKLKMEMEKITQNPFEKKALNLFDFISWLESKTEKRPFAEIVKEKANLLSEN